MELQIGGHIVWAACADNDAAEWADMVSPSLQEHYGPEWQARVDPRDLQNCLDQLQAALTDKRPFTLEYRLQAQWLPAQGHRAVESVDGKSLTYRWVMEGAKPWRGAKGQQAGWYVGWRKENQEMKEAVEDYHELWNFPNLIYVKGSDQGFNFSRANPAYVRLTGWTEEDVKSYDWRDILHPDDREPGESLHFSIAEDGSTLVQIENRHRIKDGVEVPGPVFVDGTGRYKWISWLGTGITAGGRDVTLEKLALLELAASKEELQRVADAIPGAVFRKRIEADGTDHYPFMSKGSLELLGRMHKDIQKEAGLAVVLLEPKDQIRVAEEYRKSAETGKPVDFECQIKRYDNGAERWLRVHAVPQPPDGTGALEFCGIAQDMTERHRQEEALKEARDQAERASRAKGTFLSAMSHEIRSPLNAVIGMGALLLDTSLTEEQLDYVRTIRSSSEALMDIINDILDFSKIEAGRMELEEAPFDLRDCVEDSLDLVTSQAVAKGLELTYNIDESVPAALKGDVSRLRQILVNLLSNAVKFTNVGNVSVTVSAKPYRSEHPSETPPPCTAKHTPQKKDLSFENPNQESNLRSVPQGSCDYSEGESCPVGRPAVTSNDKTSGKLNSVRAVTSNRDTAVNDATGGKLDCETPVTSNDTTPTESKHSTPVTAKDTTGVSSHQVTAGASNDTPASKTGRGLNHVPAVPSDDVTDTKSNHMRHLSRAWAIGPTFEVHFAVSDTGIGIPKDRKHPLFQAFSQCDPSTTRKYGGTGLGLAICAKLCSLQGGNIWVESSEGKGSTFHFTIVAPSVNNAVYDELEAGAQAVLAKKRALVVAGPVGGVSHKMLLQHLRGWRMRPLVVESAEELQAVTTKGETNGVAVVLIDHSALQRGNEAIRMCLKHHERLGQKLPIILLSMYGKRAINEASANGLQVTAQLSKPIKASQLLQTLLNLFGAPNKVTSPSFRCGHTSFDTQLGSKYPLRVLVAEDNLVNQKVVQNLLARMGYTCDIVSNGLEVLEAFERQRYDVCLMDCFMPELDGFAATRWVRQHVRPCPIIVAVTAAALEDEKNACLEAGMHMYISKPIGKDELQNALIKCWQIKSNLQTTDWTGELGATTSQGFLN